MTTRQRPELIDIGANLTHDSFDHDREQVLARARAAGVAQLVLTGTTAAASEQARDYAAAHPGVLYATAGLHPHHARDFDEQTLARLRALAVDDSVVAVGECGLDYFRNFSTPADQRRAFVAQLELAAELGKPAFLHQRDAHEEFVAIVGEYRDRLTGAVAHCFTGDREQARAYLDLDLYLGVTGWICDERRGHALREAVAYIPPERLMIETDAPYLLPRDLVPKPKSRRNEPLHLPHVLRAVAASAGREAEWLAAQTTANARAFFGLPAANDAVAGA